METNKQKVINYVIIITSILVIAILGSIFVNIGSDWFNSLQIPNQFVPNFVIPIVWSVIYTIFAVVLCVWINKQKLPKKVFWLLIVNGILNILWCLFFFTLKQTLLGLIAIVALLISAWWLILEIKKHRLDFFYSTLIYPVWVSLATCLNLALWILN